MSEPRWQQIHIHPRAPAKPAWGAPCNGCGQCCLVEPCPLGMLVSRKRRGACDALRWDDTAGRYVCGMLARPLIGRLARRWISAGSGCDAELETEPDDIGPPA